jgi:hypothetical protein
MMVPVGFYGTVPQLNGTGRPIVAQVPTVLRTHSDGPWERLVPALERQ